MAEPVITAIPRLIYLEDLGVTTNPSGETASVNILNAPTNPNTVHKLALVLLTDFTQAANDVAAAAAGVGIGYPYYNTATSKIKTRMT